jgi:hypothetical protein
MQQISHEVMTVARPFVQRPRTSPCARVRHGWATGGAIYEGVLQRERIARSDMDKALREADCELRDMRPAILEADGSINIMKKQP